MSCRAIRRFEKLAGKEIAWAYFSNNWIEGIKFPEQEIREIIEYGKVPFVRLMPRSSFKYGPDPVYYLQAIIEGKFDPQLRKWARKAKSLGVPLLIDFALEMNGDWFPWSGFWNGGGESAEYGDPDYPDGPERYRDAYRHIVEVFRQEGVENVTWFFHPDAVSYPEEKWNRMEYYYPGDDYVDWVGLSVYGAIFPQEREYWSELSFRKKFLKAYSQIKKFAPEKPLAILEFGVIEDPRKPDWIKNAFDTIKEFRVIKAISWWQERWENEDGTFSDLRINSSEESLQEYRRQIDSPVFVSFPVFFFSPPFF